MDPMGSIARSLSVESRQRVIDVAVEANPGLTSPTLDEILIFYAGLDWTGPADSFAEEAKLAFRVAELLGSGRRTNNAALAIEILIAAQAGKAGAITPTTVLTCRSQRSDDDGIDYDG